jgi:hypothetical protein
MAISTKTVTSLLLIFDLPFLTSFEKRLLPSISGHGKGVATFKKLGYYL